MATQNNLHFEDKDTSKLEKMQIIMKKNSFCKNALSFQRLFPRSVFLPALAFLLLGLTNLLPILFFYLPTLFINTAPVYINAPPVYKQHQTFFNTNYHDLRMNLFLNNS